MENWMIERGGDLQVYLFFGLLIVFLIVERLKPKRQPRHSQHARWRTNAALTLLTIMTLPLVPVSLITAAWWAQEQEIGVFNLAAGYISLPLMVLLTLMLRGFISFATHFLNHKVPFLWRFHRVHHLDTELDVTSTVRFHPLEMPLSMLVGLPMVVLLGLSPWVLILYELFDVAITLFSHANIRVHPVVNKYLRYFIVTPDLHKVHHSSYQPETDSNFSAVFPIWDILFGTFRTHTLRPLESMPLGLSDMRHPEANALGKLLIAPFKPLPTPNTSLEAQT
jgi:sterol desaturase/sphingolipid hydroxylase (fatty acid hydroxylase superfamily)